MTTTQTLPSPAEVVAERGREIYNREIRPQVEAAQQGRIVAIDIHTGSYELADDILTAAARLRARLPQAEIWFERVGQQVVHHIRSLRVFKLAVLA